VTKHQVQGVCRNLHALQKLSSLTDKRAKLQCSITDRNEAVLVMSRANHLFYQIIFAVGVIFTFCIPAVASSVTSKSNTLVANLSGPQVQMSSNWVSNTAGALQFVCCRSNGIAYWNLVHFFKPKPKPKPKPPHSSPVAVADGDPSSLVLLAVGFTGLLVAAVFARTKLRT